MKVRKLPLSQDVDTQIRVILFYVKGFYARWQGRIRLLKSQTEGIFVGTGIESTDSGEKSADQCRPGFMTDTQWWKSAASFAGTRWKHFVLPSAVLTGSNLLAVGADAWLASGMKGDDVELVKLAICAICALAASIAALVLAFWALYVWFVKLVAFCGEWFSRESADSRGMAEIADGFGKQKSFVSALMLWSSFYLLVPAIPLSVLIAVNMLCSPRFKVLGQRVLDFPPQTILLVNFMIALLSGVIVAYTLVFIALAGVADDTSAKSVSHRTLQILLRNLPAASVVLLTVAVVNVLLTAPQLILLCTPLSEQLSNNLAASLVAQVWLGISSVVIWPLSLLPFCQLVRARLSSSAIENVT